MGMQNFIHSKAVDEEITYPVISVSGELGSSPPTKCCSQEESTPLLPIASSICAKVDYGKERKTERWYNVTNTERIRSERRKKNRKNRAWKKKKKVKPFPHAILAHPHCYWSTPHPLDQTLQRHCNDWITPAGFSKWPEKSTLIRRRDHHITWHTDYTGMQLEHGNGNSKAVIQHKTTWEQKNTREITHILGIQKK